MAGGAATSAATCSGVSPNSSRLFTASGYLASSARTSSCAARVGGREFPRGGGGWRRRRRAHHVKVGAAATAHTREVQRRAVAGRLERRLLWVALQPLSRDRRARTPLQQLVELNASRLPLRVAHHTACHTTPRAAEALQQAELLQIERAEH
eukprot:3367849-Prymnesium_polylepis.2